MDTKREDNTINCGNLSFSECIKKTDGFRQDVGYIFDKPTTTKDLAEVMNIINKGELKK